MNKMEMTPIPLSSKGRALQGLLAISLIAIWVLGLYAYLTLPERIPTHFGFNGKPNSYGGKGIFLILSLAFSPAPIIFLVITKYRFTLIDQYPYLLNLPAFFTNINKIPVERRSFWVNKYFEGLLGLGVLLSLYLLFLEWEIYVGTVAGKLPSWFLPASIMMPLLFILPFIYYLRRLSMEIETEIVG